MQRSNNAIVVKAYQRLHCNSALFKPCPAIFLILVSFFALVSCDRHKLPAVKDAVILRKDSSQLYEQFPVSELSTNVPNYEYQRGLGFREIPAEQWPASIRALHPYMVCSDQGGIQMWITWLPLHDEGKYWNGYYVAVNPTESPPPQAATNHFVFERTDEDGILRLKQLKF